MIDDGRMKLQLLVLKTLGRNHIYVLVKGGRELSALDACSRKVFCIRFGGRNYEASSVAGNMEIISDAFSLAPFISMVRLRPTVREGFTLERIHRPAAMPFPFRNRRRGCRLPS